MGSKGQNVETFTFKTGKGANITLTVKAGFENRKETVWADGDATEINKNAWVQEIINMTVNGKSVDATFGKVNGKEAATWMIGKQQAAVIIPSNIMGKVINEKMEATMAMMAADEEAMKAHKAVTEKMTLSGDTF